MQRSKKILLFPFIFCLFLFFHNSCKKEEIIRIIKITTDEVTQIATKSAILNGTIVDIGEGITEHGFCWSTTNNPTIELTTKTQLGSKNSKGSFFSNLTNLTPNTTYYIRSYGSDSETVKYGNEKSFITESLTLASITIGTVSEITDSSAIVTATISNLGNGIDSILQHGFCWSTTQNPTIENDKTELGSKSSTGEFSSNLTGLSPGTTYYVRAYATNSIGIAYGDEVSFATSAILPTVTTSSVSDITHNSAESGGNITDDGGATVTARGVCWSTSQNPTISDSYTSDGSGTGSFSSSITGLSSGTTYYVRAYATNSAGTAYGDEVSFTSTATIPTVTTISASSITENSAESGGNITDNGGATVTARGVCWSTSSNPTITDDHTTDGSGTGSFTSSLTGLSFGTTYYVRAYATNSMGTSYGSEVSFTTGTVIDIDGNVYNTVTIGTQIWMSENLKTTKYNDGTAIPLVTNSTEWDNLTTPGYCWYNNDEASYKNTYGALYNWHTVNTGKLCPTGWHVPTNSEWTTLTDYLGGESIAGGKLKETGTTHWISPNTGATNESGFTALPGGYRHNNGTFYYIGNYGRWWSSTEHSSTNAWFRHVYYDYSNVSRGGYYKENGFSVRCVRDY